MRMVNPTEIQSAKTRNEMELKDLPDALKSQLSANFVKGATSKAALRSRLMEALTETPQTLDDLILSIWINKGEVVKRSGIRSLIRNMVEQNEVIKESHTFRLNVD